MAILPSAAELVARFLRANGYYETLASFVKEARLSADAGATSSSAVTIEQILQEKETFDMSLRFEKLGIEDQTHAWKNPAPSIPLILDTLPTKSNILSVHFLDLILPTSAEPRRCIVTTTADRRLNLIDPDSPSFTLLRSYSSLQDSPILDIFVLKSRYLLAGSMSGKLVLFDTATEQVRDERKDHTKYLVKITGWPKLESSIVASAGWDSRIVVYRTRNNNDGHLQLGNLLATVTVQTIPETILFIQSPDTDSPLLLATRRDSTFLYYYEVPSHASGNFEMLLRGKQNLAPQSNAWVSFAPSDVQICPSDPSVVAVATSSTPHLKLLVVRLLVPPRSTSVTNSGTSSNMRTSILDTQDMTSSTLASQTGAELLHQDREEAAIKLNITTMSPQTAYSTPKLAWRPDGSGIYVNSDDGIVRGFEVSTGKPVASLEAGHEPGSKVRCLVTGIRGGVLRDDIEPKATYEFLLSGGFDQRLIFWSAI
ncbi:WD40 repeat-like protein [Lojkania enalia]|uniref:WD40 repeat-like protein n=1 Tax=Lojkania enalia TaxID=147567 RepID=A0A9P4TRI7_9PLEO|nr:WD40 repeat-like protein [Didymosphaeria enalia]